MLKYKDKFQYIIKKIIKNKLIYTNLNNFNIKSIIYNNYLNLNYYEENDINTSNKIYYLLFILIDILKNIFLENGKIMFINSNVYYQNYYFEKLKNTTQYWLLGMYPNSYFSNKYFRNIYIKNNQSNNILINTPKYLNNYNKIIFILFYTQQIDNTLFTSEISKFTNFLNIDFINIHFKNVDKIGLNFSFLNYENQDNYIDIKYMNFFFILLNLVIFKNLNYKVIDYYFILFLRFKNNISLKNILLKTKDIKKLKKKNQYLNKNKVKIKKKTYLNKKSIKDYLKYLIWKKLYIIWEKNNNTYKFLNKFNYLKKIKQYYFCNILNYLKN